MDSLYDAKPEGEDDEAEDSSMAPGAKGRKADILSGEWCDPSCASDGSSTMDNKPISKSEQAPSRALTLKLNCATIKVHHTQAKTI